MAELAISTADVLEQHPDRDRLLAADREVKDRFGPDDGLTLMCYCVRWNRRGDRLLFFFGNHCVPRLRDEPKVTCVYTADRDLNDLRLAVDLSFDRRGVHWGWHPDGESLIGYGPDPDTGRPCIARVDHTGDHYRKLATHASGGHPNVSPTDPDLLVTDATGQSRLDFIDLRVDRVVASATISRSVPDARTGRTPDAVDLHPVFDPDGGRVLVNTLTDGMGTPVELAAPALP